MKGQLHAVDGGADHDVDVIDDQLSALLELPPVYALGAVAEVDAPVARRRHLFGSWVVVPTAES
jgi:hypothetical protein